MTDKDIFLANVKLPVVVVDKDIATNFNMTMDVIRDSEGKWIGNICNGMGKFIANAINHEYINACIVIKDSGMWPRSRQEGGNDR